MFCFAFQVDHIEQFSPRRAWQVARSSRSVERLVSSELQRRIKLIEGYKNSPSQLSTGASEGVFVMNERNVDEETG